MNNALHITFRNIPRSRYIEHLIHNYFNRLHCICNQVRRCQVAIEKTAASSNGKKNCRVYLALTALPAYEFAATLQQNHSGAQTALAADLRQVFSQAHRSLMKYKNTRRTSSLRPTNRIALYNQSTYSRRFSRNSRKAVTFAEVIRDYLRLKNKASVSSPI